MVGRRPNGGEEEVMKHGRWMLLGPLWSMSLIVLAMTLVATSSGLGSVHGNTALVVQIAALVFINVYVAVLSAKARSAGSDG